MVDEKKDLPEPKLPSDEAKKIKGREIIMSLRPRDINKALTEKPTICDVDDLLPDALEKESKDTPDE